MTTLLQAPSAMTPVHSKPDGVVYLVMERCAGGYAVLIRKTRRAKAKLGPYWKVQVRELLFKLDEKYVKQVTFSSKGVWFVSERPAGEWIVATQCLLANIVPLAEPPMTLADDDEGFWKVHPCADLSEIIDKVVLPDAAKRFFTLEGGHGYVKLRRSGVGRNKCTLSISEVRLMVELQVALACTRDGVPLDCDEIWLRHMRAQRRAAITATPRGRPARRPVATVELPRPPRARRRTVRGASVERNKP